MEGGGELCKTDGGVWAHYTAKLVNSGDRIQAEALKVSSEISSSTSGPRTQDGGTMFVPIIFRQPAPRKQAPS